MLVANANIINNLQDTVQFTYKNISKTVKVSRKHREKTGRFHFQHITRDFKLYFISLLIVYRSKH